MLKRYTFSLTESAFESLFWSAHSHGMSISMWIRSSLIQNGSMRLEQLNPRLRPPRLRAPALAKEPTPEELASWFKEQEDDADAH